ncbi:unnamed protein product [Pylaiella littoralis]
MASLTAEASAAAAAAAAAEDAGSSALEDEIAQSVMEGKGWKDGEREAYLKQVSEEDHPMFAENIEDVDPGVVKAFQDLTYEDETPLSLGEHFKQLGNDRFKRGKNNALYFRHAQQVTWFALYEGGGGGMLRNCRIVWKINLNAVAAALLANRAAANLALKNYGSCRKDCDESLALSPGNVKCLYRKAKAGLLLRKHRDALAACEEGLKIDPSNADLLKIKQECDKALKAAGDAAAASRRQKEERLERLAAVWDECESAGVKLGPSGFDESNHEQRNAFLPLADEEGGVIWPVLLLYPQHGQSDLIEAFRDADMLAEHLAQAFPEEGPPAPWDQSFEYRCSELVIYLPLRPVEPSPSVFEWIADFEDMEAAKLSGPEENSRRSKKKAAAAAAAALRPQRWARVHPGCTLMRILACEDHVVAGATPTLLVFPKDGQSHRDFVRDSGGRIVALDP